ncbi:MAG TPA: fused MFS/spermidine synthase [Thermoanaerobaculia bacterium]|jgi:spermidine synthase|nr:fused MFS/spermidine synthase [Thermoanaerobaculia bacterium]
MKRVSRQTVPPASAPGGRSLLLATVCFTNLLSLACQVLWLRKVSSLFGSTAVVLSTVVSIFLLGLAGGALWGGRVADRAARPWRLLGWLQILLGAWVAVSLPIFDLGRDLFLAIAPADLAPLPSALAKLAVVLVCMIAPTLVIGAVFPLAVRLAAGETGHLGRELSLVYGLDTLGAALGALLAGFFLVPQCGLSASTWILGIGAVDLGVFILLRQRERPMPAKKARKGRKEPRERREMTPAEPDATPVMAPSPGRLRLVLVTFFLSGGGALLLETGWNRFFSLLNGTHVFSTSTVLAGFLAGIGAGSLLMARFIDRIRDLYAAAAGLFAAVALGGVAVFRSAAPFSRAYFRIFQWSSGYNPFQLTVCLLILLIVLLATLAMGAAFPLVVRIATRSGGERGVAAGRAFFANTLGGVAGALLAEFVLLPAWGFSGLMTATVAIYAVAAAVFLALSPSPGSASRRWLPATGVVALLAGAVVLSPAVLPFAPPFHALYYYGLRIGNWPGYEAEVKSMKLVEQRQGFYGQVAVVSVGPYLLLKSNGKTDASSAPTDDRTQLLLGHLPLLFHPNPRRVLNIGLGGGFTLRAVVHHPEPREVTVVEIDPRVVAAAHTHFGSFNDHALDDPRVRVVTNDGRNFVDGLEGRRFDVITSEPPNVWVSGASGLFTRELYRSAANRLASDGILCQWVPLSDMKKNDFRMMIHTIHTVFPYVAFWQVGTDVIVLASAQPLQADLDQVKARLRSPALERDFTGIGLSGRGVLELMNSPVVRPDQVDAFLGGFDSLNLDDRPVLEFNTARNLFDVAKGK